LAPLAAAVWAVVGRDGRLAMPVRRAGDPEAVCRLLENLEKMARYHHALALDNPTTLLRGKVDLRLRRRAGGGWAGPLEEHGVPVFYEKDFLEIEIVNRHTEQLFFHVVDFGLTGKVELLYPVEGAREPLVRDRSLQVGTLPGQELELFIPPELPFEPLPPGIPVSGTEFVKLFVTTHEADFRILFQEGYRGDDEETDDSPLGRLLRSAMWGGPLRGPTGDRRDRLELGDWTTVTREFLLKRR
jgi:hypothetical protein